jgi:hypothetical protein
MKSERKLKKIPEGKSGGGMKKKTQTKLNG